MKRKTPYTVQFTCPPAAANQIVQNWLAHNQFQFESKDGFEYFKSGDAIVKGFRFFEYSIQGSTLYIQAYLKSPKKPFPLDNGMVGALSTAPYVDLINQLIAEVQTAGMQGNPQAPYGQPDAATNYANYGNVAPNAGYSQSYSNVPPQAQPPVANKQADWCAIISFIIALSNLILVLGDSAFGIFIVVIGYVAATMGMKGKHRKLSVAAMIILSVSLIILLVKIAMHVLF